MKKYVFGLILALLAANVSFAQNDEVTNAFMEQKNGKLDKAKMAIDKAAIHEKTSTKAKTWYFRGNIYKDIANSPLPAYKSLDPNAAKIAFESYSKAMELDGKGGQYYNDAMRERETLWNTALNNGVNKYQEKKFAEALSDYEMAAELKPQDTTAYLYGAYAAESLKDYTKVRQMYEKLIQLNYRRADMYRTLGYVARTLDKDDNKALGYVQEGRKYFPTDKNLALDELNLYFTLNKIAEAKSKLEEAVKLDPNNGSLYASLGTIYDQEANDSKKPAAEKATLKRQAIDAYMKALEIDPKNSDANFNMGVYHFNLGADISKKVSGMNLNDYNKTGKKLESDANGHYNRALPYFEKAYAETPTDKDVKASLKKTYLALKRMADADKLN